MPSSVRELFVKFVAALNAQDRNAMAELMTPDYVGFYPQSGERFRGFEAFWAQLERYPGGLQPGPGDADEPQLVGDDERWAITPGYTVLPLSGPERYTTVVRTTYPDGSTWHVVSIVQVRDGRIAASETYFAPKFDPPAWRSDIVEVVPSDDRPKP